MGLNSGEKHNTTRSSAAVTEFNVLSIFDRDDITLPGKIIACVCSRAISFYFKPIVVASRNSVTRGSSRFFEINQLDQSIYIYIYFFKNLIDEFTK